MTAIWTRINTLLLLLVLFALVGLAGMFAAGVLGGPLDPPGPPAATDSVRLPGTPISSLPYIASQPGHYYLTRSLSIPLGSPDIGIHITADDVTLDLGGFTITGVDPLEQNAINVDGARAHISNGTLRNAVGVEAAGSVGLRISGVAVYDSAYSAFRVGPGTLIEDCIVSGNGEYGLYLQASFPGGSRVTIRRCVIRNNGLAGVHMAQSANGVLIEDSVIKGNNTSASVTSAGIVINDADDTTVRGNDMAFNGVADIYVLGDNNVIVDNIISCPTSIVLVGGSINTFAPVNTTDPHTNRAHRLAC